MSKEYGYARISTPKQNIDRQVRNILAAHPQAHIIKEVFTGTKFQGRKDLDKLLRTVKPGDTKIQRNEMPRQLITVVQAFFVIDYVMAQAQKK